MPLPRFSGQQLLRKDINEKGSGGERERERDRRGDVGLEGAAAGMRWGQGPGFEEPGSGRDGVFSTPAV